MDYTKIFLAFCCLLVCHAAHIPEVYESINNPPKQAQQDTYEKPPAFNYEEYQKGTQFDPQRIRYQQQQLLDKDGQRPRQARTELEHKNEQKGGAEVITAPTRMILEDLEKETPQLPKGRIAKKSLKPNSYLVSEEAEPGQKRQDDSSYLNYVDRSPKSLQQNHGFLAPTASENLHALNSLLGQSPENQLHGLQQLLNSNNGNNHGNQYYKDHTPIKEDYNDIPNSQNKPNVRVQHQNSNQNHHNQVNQALHSFGKNGNQQDSLKSLQAQLDATASAHAESIIAQAQKKALEHVKAQHEAIARAQKAADHAAFAQIKAQNEALTRAHAQAEAEAEAKRQEEQKEKDEKRKAAERRRNQEHARERARIAALAYKHKQEQQAQKEKEDKEQKDDPHTVAQTTRVKNSQKQHKKFQTFAAEPAETQHHYFTAPTQLTHYQPQQLTYHQPATTAQTYHQSIQAQQPVHYEPKPKYSEPKYDEHQHQDHADVVSKYYVPPQFTVIGETKNSHGESELQYAANYEFGYRIHDYDHGNDFGHKESKDGETTKGEYHVLLPDGRTQTVTYYVDPSGYHAEVSYGGGHEGSTGHH